jgi:hypothetical protein
MNGQHSRWLRVGEHAVLLESDSATERFSVHVEANKTMIVRPTRVMAVLAKPAPPARAPLTATERAQPPKPLSNRWFWGGAIATGAFGIATAVSGLDTLATRSEFRANPTNEDLAFKGSSAEARTNVLLVSTLVLAAATGAVGYFVFSRPDAHGK